MPKLYTVKALAELFDKDEETIRCWIRQGDVFLKAFKVKDGWYVPASDVKRLMNGHAADSAPETPASGRSFPKKRFVREW